MLNQLPKMTDMSLIGLCQGSPVIEHVEVNKCTGLTDYSIGVLIRQCPTLKFIDINFIPGFKYQILDELRNLKPELLIRRYATQEVNPKDTGLRVPLRIVSKKKKKKKKKGKKKK